MSLKTDLVWYWDLSAAGATITDQHRGLTLSQIGTTTTDLTGGPDGGPCISFGTAAGKYRNGSVAKTVNYNNGYSANIWVRSTGSGSFFNLAIMHRANPPGLIPGGVYFQIAARDSTGVDYSWTFGSGSTQFREASSAQESLNAWQMLTVADDGSTATLYRNGVSVATSSTALGARNTIAAPFSIGGSWNAANDVLSHRGQLAKAGVWDRVLTSTEILRLYNGGKGRNYDDLDKGGLPTIVASHYAALGI